MSNKPIQPAHVTPVPTPVPSRTDRVNFAPRGDAMMGWFPPGVDGINENVDYLNAVADFVEQQTNISLAASNFKGDWSSQAGQLLKPASVRHAGEYWMLLNDLADVAVSQPGVSADWVPVYSSGAVVGAMRIARMSVGTASASATFTADQVVVAGALGGTYYRLNSVNKTINLATTGAGGMDTGTAPVSGFVAIYAIYNPSTGASALLARNAATKQNEVYGGANMPAGYTASALVGVWPTNASGQFVVGYQEDRKVRTPYANLLNTTTQQAALVSLSIAGYVPPNAKTVSGQLTFGLTASGTGATNVAATASGIGGQYFNGYCPAGGTVQTPFNDLALATPQTLFYIAVGGAGTYGILGSAYTF